MLRFIGKTKNTYLIQNEETLLVSFCEQEGCCKMLHNNYIIRGLKLIGFQLVENLQEAILPEQFRCVHDTAKRFCYDLVRSGFDTRSATYQETVMDSTTEIRLRSRISCMKKLYTTSDRNSIGHKLGRPLRVCPKLDKYIGKVPVVTISSGILGTIKRGYLCYDTDGKLYEVLLFLC